MRQAESFRRVGVGETGQVAEHDGGPILGRQSTDLGVDRRKYVRFEPRADRDCGVRSDGRQRFVSNSMRGRAACRGTDPAGHAE
jgi:hypothetical protein